MLLSLHIENVAVIKKLDIDFSGGFTVLTGETGAGKSIIIDSINLLLGAKAEKELIRNGEDALMVSGLFGRLRQYELDAITEFGVETDEDGNLLIQRSVTKDGRSTVRINGRTVNLSVLKNVSARLVSIHGQSDTGALLNPAMHISLLDTYASATEIAAEYSERYSEYEKIRKDIRSILEKENESERLREILKYQIKEDRKSVV